MCIYLNLMILIKIIRGFISTQRIVGVSLLCVDSHEMINIVKTVMDADLPYTVLRDQIFTHPTMSESLNDLFSLIK